MVRTASMRKMLIPNHHIAGYTTDRFGSKFMKILLLGVGIGGES